jgi:hypothetical protein
VNSNDIIIAIIVVGFAWWAWEVSSTLQKIFTDLRTICLYSNCA